MALPLSAPRYTIDQVRAFPPDGQRYELLDGVLLVTPAPRNLHQVVAFELAVRLHRALVPAGLGRVFSPGALEFGDRTLLAPHLLVYPAPHPPTAHWKPITDWFLAHQYVSH